MREVNVIAVGIFKARYLIPKRIHLFGAVLLDLVDIGQIIDVAAVGREL